MRGRPFYYRPFMFRLVRQLRCALPCNHIFIIDLILGSQSPQPHLFEHSLPRTSIAFTPSQRQSLGHSIEILQHALQHPRPPGSARDSLRNTRGRVRDWFGRTMVLWFAAPTTHTSCSMTANKHLQARKSTWDHSGSVRQDATGPIRGQNTDIGL